MANNRIWLLHKPTGKAVFLGKRMAHGWYGTPSDLADKIEALFEHSINKDDTYRQDDFALAMEDCSGAPHGFDDWHYSEDALDENGLRTLKLGPAPK